MPRWISDFENKCIPTSDIISDFNPLQSHIGCSNLCPIPFTTDTGLDGQLLDVCYAVPFRDADNALIPQFSCQSVQL
jgi:hypothetical protein